MTKIAPSILSADFTRLGACIAEAEAGGADWIHIDVMDGHFVPNITIGPLIVEAARRATQLPLDVHLMIEHPDVYLEAFRGAGADRITVHQEACTHLQRTVQRIRELGAAPGVALNPATPVATLADILPFIDLALVMTVNPGFGGQRFIPEALPKVTQLAAEAEAKNLAYLEIEVDGGINTGNAALAAAAGATVLVAGSAVFGEGDIRKNIGNLKRSLAVEV